MALGLSAGSTGGEFLPLVTWDARAGRMFRRDRTQGASGWETVAVDITMERPKFAFDMGGIEVGFIAFLPTGPDFHLAPLGAPMPAKPSKDHKAGFRARVAGNALGGVREFSASAKSVLSSVDDLHSKFEAAPEAAQGLIPVVELSGSSQVVTNGPQGKVTSYSPQFTIVQWVPREESIFGARTVPAPSAKATTAAPAAAHTAPPSNHVPPPAHAAPPPAASAAPNSMPF